jgi:cell division protein FtsX
VRWRQLRQYSITPAMQASQRQALLSSTLDLAPGSTGWSGLRLQFAQPLAVLMAGVVLILLLACANVANLLLARSAARRREFAVRLAIGASRARLVRQLLTESLLLAAAGGFLGLWLAHAGSQLLLRLFSTGQFDVVALDVAPNARILVFATAIAFATAILFGLAPAFRASALAPVGELTQRSAVQRTGEDRLSTTLVVFQVAVSLVLLTGAGLFVGTLRNLGTLDTGFRRDGVLLVQVDPRKEGYQAARLKALYLELLERLERLPGVAAVSLSSNTPLSGGIYCGRR